MKHFTTLTRRFQSTLTNWRLNPEMYSRAPDIGDASATPEPREPANALDEVLAGLDAQLIKIMACLDRIERKIDVLGSGQW